MQAPVQFAEPRDDPGQVARRGLTWKAEFREELEVKSQHLEQLLLGVGDRRENNPYFLELLQACFILFLSGCV